MTALVGYTGFVGSNILAGAQRSGGKIDALYNSANIAEAFGTKPDLLIFSGLRAEKYLANNAPEKDMALIRQAEENIAGIDPRKLVLISTIDVFKAPRGVDESSPVDTEELHPYGLDRYRLEQWVRERYPDALIIRLPGLFGKNIKKNLIFDYINVIPFMLSGAKLAELSAAEPSLAQSYELQPNGFYRVKPLSDGERAALKATFGRLGFSALSFTDSRSVYQFYDLARLWDDIRTALGAGLTLWHPATEPVRAGDLVRFLSGKEFTNELGGAPASYDYRTLHAELFGGRDGYVESAPQVMEKIKKFVSEVVR